MKTILLLITTMLISALMHAQTIQPGVRTTFHAVDDKGKPISEEIIEVEVTFAKKDANGNMVPVYSEKFSSTTTKDGYFQREIGAQFGDLPTVTFGKYKDVDFTDPNLQVRVDFRRTEMFNAPWIMGKYSPLNPVPVAAKALKTKESQVLDFDPLTKILYLSDGNYVNLSSLSQFQQSGNQLTTNKTVNAAHFTTTNGFTDIEEGKISFRYSNGQDGIEMGVEDDLCSPFISFLDCEGNTLGSIRMGPEGFQFYKN